MVVLQKMQTIFLNAMHPLKKCNSISNHKFIFPFYRSFEKEKDWEIVFNFVFSEEGLINQSYFITKNIGKIIIEY